MLSTPPRHFLLYSVALCLCFATLSAMGDPGPAGAAGAAVSADAANQSRVLAAAAKEILDGYEGDSSAFATAAAKLNEALALDEGNADAYVEMARLAMKQDGLRPETLEHAEKLLRKGLAAEPGHGNSYVLLGYVLMQEGMADVAEQAFADAHRFGASSPWLGMNEAALAAARGDRAAAQAKYSAFANAAQLPAKVRSQAFTELARDATKHREPAKALTAYEQALKLDPDSAWLMGDYARALRVLALDLPQSEHWARRALEKMDYRRGRENLGETLYLEWAEALITEQNEAKAKMIFSEAREYLEDPLEILHEINGYPRAHPIVAALAKQGYSLDRFAGATGGTTPLTKAAAQPNLAIVKALLDAGANPNVQGYGGETALIIAAMNGNAAMVDALLKAGADPTLRAADGTDAQMAAVRARNDAIARRIEAARLVQKTPPTTSHALRSGYVYRVRVPSKAGEVRYSDAFEAGEELVYQGEGALLARGGTVETEMVGHRFRVRDGLLSKVWASPREKGDEAWTDKFDEIGPAESADR
ncbi:MAG TPA: ankyrin repeat domain-containing protein [Dokdonella sp.]|nr:ankyrin repeat domain-containing protein [Dokdonella sp.]